MCILIFLSKIWAKKCPSYMAKYSCWTELLSLPAVALIQGSFLETTEEVVIDTCFWLLLNTNTTIWGKK